MVKLALLPAWTNLAGYLFDLLWCEYHGLRVSGYRLSFSLTVP